MGGVGFFFGVVLELEGVVVVEAPDVSNIFSRTVMIYL